MTTQGVSDCLKEQDSQSVDSEAKQFCNEEFSITYICCVCKCEDKKNIRSVEKTGGFCVKCWKIRGSK